MRLLIDRILAFKQQCRLEEEVTSRLAVTAREASLVCALSDGAVFHAGDLAHRIRLSPSRLSRLLGSLQKKGHLTWHTSRDDRRALDIKLTKKGLELCNRLDQAKQDCERQLRTRLTKAEIAAVEKGLLLLEKAL